MRYSWSHPASTIREVEFKPVGKRTEALIYAPAGTEDGAFSAITEALRRAGLPAVIPDVVDGRHVLRVEEANKTAVLQTLEYSGMVMGTPTAEPDKKLHEGFSEKFKKNTVRAAGYTYVLGDALMIAGGLLRMKGLWNNPNERKGGMNEMAAGITWAVPNVGLIIYGKKNPELQLGVLLRGMQNYLVEQGIAIPEEDRRALEQLSRPDDTLHRLEEFFYDHPTQINNTIEALGGLKLLSAGYNQKIGFDERPNYYKMGQAVCVSGGMTSSVLVQEKKKPLFEQAAQARQADEKKGLLTQAADWFAEKPLRLAGWGAGANNILGLIGPAIYERPKTRDFLAKSVNGVAGKTEAEVALQRMKAKNYLGASGFNIGTALAFLAANGMYSLGSKDTGVDLKASGALDQLYALAAHVIAAHPKEEQLALTNQLAGYFSTREEIKDSLENISRSLNDKVHGLNHSPWTQRVQTAAAPEMAQAAL